LTRRFPNGYCTLPEQQTCDFAPTPCLSCKSFFRTTPTFLPVHIRQRDETMRQLDLALREGRQRAVEAHERTLSSLNAIIGALESEQLQIDADETATPAQQVASVSPRGHLVIGCPLFAGRVVRLQDRHERTGLDLSN
jgi:hypothetical protein